MKLTGLGSRVAGLLRNAGLRSTLIITLVCAFALLRVASTHRVFSPTFDEPIHVAGGYQYLTEKQYTTDLEHPPFARAFFAWPLRHVSVAPDSNPADRGNRIYTAAGDYMRSVARARRGNLIFFLIALVAITAWTRDMFGDNVAILACAIFSVLPPVLAHAGLATTDMAGTAAYATAMWWLYRWLAMTSWPRTIVFGVIVGLGSVTKLSFPVFFTASLIVVLVALRRFPIAKGLVAVAIALVVVWGVHKFEVAPLNNIDAMAAAKAQQLGVDWVANMSWPAPSYVVGLIDLALHNRGGHPAYFLGTVSDKGRHLTYFPVVFAIKTPIPLIILAVAGAWFVRREIVFLPVVILAISMSSNINIGVRHILPIYVPLSILAACAFTRAKWLAIAMLAWLAIGSVAAHPDYIPWANAFAGRHPERIVLDSNFDWGQDVARLRTVARREHIDSLATFLFGTTDQHQIGLPPYREIDPYTHQTGWIAVSESAIIPAQARDPIAYLWLTSGYKFQRIGKTIRLYHVTEEN